MLRAFCTALPSPMAPYSAASDPITTAEVDPVNPSGARNWSPMIGSCDSAESSTCCWRSGSPASTKPRICVPSSSNGKIAKSE